MSNQQSQQAHVPVGSADSSRVRRTLQLIQISSIEYCILLFTIPLGLIINMCITLEIRDIEDVT